MKTGRPEKQHYKIEAEDFKLPEHSKKRNPYGYRIFLVGGELDFQ